jgi:hypothetical protein
MDRQIVADAYAAFGQGDIGAVIDLLTDDVVWINHVPAGAPTSRVFHGKDGVQTSFELVNDTLDISKFDVRMIVSDGDVAVAWIDAVATIRSNGKTIEGPLALDDAPRRQVGDLRRVRTRHARRLDVNR